MLKKYGTFIQRGIDPERAVEENSFYNAIAR